MSSASSTTRPARATSASIPALGAGWRPARRSSPVVARGVDGRRAAGVRLRRQGGGLRRARRRRRSPARRSSSPASSLGSVLTVAYSARFVWGVFLGARTLARPAPPAAAVGARPVAVVRRARRGPRRRDSCSAWCPASPTGSSAPRPRRSTPTPTPCTSRSGTASTWPSSVGRSRWSAALAVRLPRRAAGPCSPRRPHPHRHATPTSALLRAHEPVADRVTGVVQNGSLPDLRRRHPAHRRRGARRRAAASAATGPGWPTSSTSAARSSPSSSLLLGAALAAAVVRRRFSAALFLGAAGYAMAGAVRRAGRARPGPHPGGHRDAVDRAVRARAAPAARPLRAPTAAAPAGRCALVVSALVGVTVFVFAIVAAAPAPPSRCRTRWSSGRCPTATAATSST